ncbi:diaminobutyrate aminotransferase [Paraperlucidibaca baekdonensis]|uniref:Diaminobutyrate--2-oxoglutarate transaminase n=1 Tax=Paraperlucidibaca baekdonensis TaxID=748120 RepID=A0A3E0H984_9GAMM|nr:diaminobutyrate--2-oxoglutarate transaminase [Paraperlucidibaca baekdonensis]REH40277.1 diaminobutyrate aminotransferase [Paraperlucidibaca baekdonensis]
MPLAIFDRLESEVRSYVRSYPTVFARAVGSHITNEDGREYLDFFAGAGSLNYGHNHPTLKAALIEYLQADGILHGLDMATQAKREFMETFERTILKPRRLDYKMQFTGPTGTNAVEAALKLARQVKSRNNILCFTNAFHGVTTGSVAATGSSKFRDATGASLTDTQFVPYANYYGRDVNTLNLIEKQLSDPGSGMDAPAAVLVECIQGEGGINTASADWLRGLASLCRRHDMLLIVDDIQMGCGRTGSFFSFEQAGINPDIVTLSKSISGYGLPMALVLIKPEYDIWAPSAHNGTFRGNNAAFVTATAALNTFWADNSFADDVRVKGRLLHQRLEHMRKRHPHITALRGRGMVAGIVLENSEMADAVSERCFEQGLIIETCGPHGEVVKMLPPLIMSEADLEKGLQIFDEALTHARRTLAPAVVEEISA